jgi:nucleoid-associated protein YgaU
MSKMITAIKEFLSVLILLGVLVIISVFGYRYITNDPSLDKLTDEDSNSAKQSVAKTSQQTNEKDIKTVNVETHQQNEIASDTKKPGGEDDLKELSSKKLYTQEEVQELMEMLLDQVKELNKSGVKISTKLTVNGDEGELVESLNSIEVDKVDQTQESVPTSDPTQTVKNDSNTQHIDNYNKVTVDATKENDDRTKNLQNIVYSIDSKVKNELELSKTVQNEITQRAKEMRVIVVKRGDTLSKIAKRAYGDPSYYTIIYEANPHLIKNPNKIYIGQKLRVPLL